jgi:hypothetical protein
VAERFQEFGVKRFLVAGPVRSRGNAMPEARWSEIPDLEISVKLLVYARVLLNRRVFGVDGRTGNALFTSAGLTTFAVRSTTRSPR